MKRIAIFSPFAFLTLVFVGCAFSQPDASIPNIDWIKVQKRESVLGVYFRNLDGAEVYTLEEKFCMITCHPKEASSATNEVVLGWTNVGDWKVTDKGLVVVTCPLLQAPVFFAFVRQGDKEGMLRVSSADERPPLRMDKMTFHNSLYHKVKSPNQALEPTPTAVTPRADARVAPAAGVAHL
jgi:hypothetical protein